ncbi:MAG: hypothetical protein COC01_04640 [Bacteroidetes bacterium]|nr:MAG: hypothetical protein COC01_04640 [Bacteroidota bacterium]
MVNSAPSDVKSECSEPTELIAHSSIKNTSVINSAPSDVKSECPEPTELIVPEKEVQIYWAFCNLQNFFSTKVIRFILNNIVQK